MAKINGVFEPFNKYITNQLKLRKSIISSQGILYTIKDGDTLGKISQKFNTIVKEIMDLNPYNESSGEGIKNKNQIRTGQEIRIGNTNLFNRHELFYT